MKGWTSPRPRSLDSSVRVVGASGSPLNRKSASFARGWGTGSCRQSRRGVALGRENGLQPAENRVGRAGGAYLGGKRGSSE